MTGTERLADRVVTSSGPGTGVVTVRVKRRGEESTYDTTATVKRVRQAGEVFYDWSVPGWDRGTTSSYTTAVLVAAHEIERINRP